MNYSLFAFKASLTLPLYIQIQASLHATITSLKTTHQLIGVHMQISHIITSTISTIIIASSIELMTNKTIVSLYINIFKSQYPALSL